MKPVVSLVALAITLAPFTVFASPTEKSTHAEKAPTTKVVHKKTDKRHDKDARHIKSSQKGVHHASGVEFGGGHKEPKVERGVAVVPAAMKTVAHRTVDKAVDPPRLPDPKAGKPSKGGAEKGARKPAQKKHHKAADASDGTTERDEDLAELVARIRGRHGDKSDVVKKVDDRAAEEKAEPVADEHAARKEEARKEKAAPSDDTDEKEDKPSKRTSKKKTAAKLCTKDPIEVIRGPEVDRFELTRCDGTLAPLAVEHLSIAVRPGSAARPVASVADLAKKTGTDLAQGVRRVDPRMALRLQQLVDHFTKTGSVAKVAVVSGYRPASVGSLHSSGRAIDFRIEGVKNEDLVAFCKTLPDTGCGFYPNSSFVHVDVRDPGVGHVHWIDASSPNESPRYVAAWPPARQALREASDRHETKLDKEALPASEDDHPADVNP